MSGIYIPGMEMPKHCWSCCFHDEVDDCIILKESCMTVWGEQKRLDNCPLIAVQSHGNLIEKNIIEKAINDACDECKDVCIEFDGFFADCDQCFLQRVKKALIDAPTIIPADKGGAE